MYIEKNKFGGNCYQQDINCIMLDNAKRYSLNYSHKKENRWNLWMQDSGMTLSFVLNNGLFIPSLSGIRRKTLEKFYSSSPADVDSWVKHSIKEYLSTLKEAINQLNIKKELECYEAYLESKYAQEREEFLTEEEIASMYQEPEEVKEVKKLVRKTKKSREIPGQLSLFDLEGWK